jgi:peptide deformylase
MAIRPILTVPNPTLRKKAKRIQVIDKSIHKLVADMLATLEHAAGLGLAAPQVGVSLRLCVLHMPEEKPFALVNPEVVKRIGQRDVVEGCLSIPGYQGRIKRSVEVTVKGLDMEGKPVRFKAREILAQALEHEIDHLNGVLYIDYLEKPDLLVKVEDTPAQVRE